MQRLQHSCLCDGIGGGWVLTSSGGLIMTKFIVGLLTIAAVTAVAAPVSAEKAEQSRGNGVCMSQLAALGYISEFELDRVGQLFSGEKGGTPGLLSGEFGNECGEPPGPGHE